MTPLLLAAALLVQSSPAKPTFVIVHGAWGGGWDWRTVDSLLTKDGYRVVRVTLTGLGERRHLTSANIGLYTHIDDVVNKILWDDMHDVILLGHSYGGMVITGVADRVPDRIKRLIYLDALLPDSGESVLTMQSADTGRANFIASLTRGDYTVPSWVQDTTVIPRDVPMSRKTFTDTLRLVNPARRRLPATYILTFEPQVNPDPFQRYADRAAARGWPVQRMQADHIPERTNPTGLVALLERVL
ncbi:MAG: alpha/beta fold hydrolase [Gemmatimonadota bacterium]